MREHIEDILVGGRPMTDVEIELQKRIDKAIDYIINHSDVSGSFDGKVFYVERVENIKNGTKLLNILKGDGSNEKNTNK